MHLKAIKLPPHIIADLYSKSLVEPGNSIVATAPKNEQAIETAIQDGETDSTTGDTTFLGNNGKYILVMVNNPSIEFLAAEDLAFLTNMLSACRLSLDDVAILNLSKIKSPLYKELFNRFNSRVVLLLGTPPSSVGLPIDFPHFQVQPFNTSTLLYTPALETMKNDTLLKSKLWVCLRRVFNV